jgi:hypothetical protein
MPTLARPVSGRWAAVGERGWVESGQQRLGGSGKMRSNNKVTQGTLALDLCSGVFGGYRKGASGQQRFWEGELLRCLGKSCACAGCKCCVMSLRCVRIAGGHKHLDQVRTSRGCSDGAASGFWELSGRARVKTLEGRITVFTSNE